MSEWADIGNSLDAFGHVWDDGDLGSITITNRVSVRDRLGRFAAQVDEANRRATEEALSAGARAMAEAAPKKTGRLASSIDWHSTGTKTGEITIGTSYWKYVAYGTRPHPITGMVSFYWDRMARRWVPGRNIIRHPGSPPHDFIEVGLHVARDTLTDTMRREYRYIS